MMPLSIGLSESRFPVTVRPRHNEAGFAHLFISTSELKIRFVSGNSYPAADVKNTLLFHNTLGCSR